MLECRSSSFEAAEAALLAPLRDPPLPGGGHVVHTSRMAVDTFQVMLKPCCHCVGCLAAFPQSQWNQQRILQSEMCKQSGSRYLSVGMLCSCGC